MRNPDSRYYIWLIEIWHDEGAVYYYPLALSYEPEQWFADLFKSKWDDDASIVKFTTNLTDTDHRWLNNCTLDTGDYNDNECAAIRVSNVGICGNTPVMLFKPIINNEGQISIEMQYFQEEDE